MLAASSGLNTDLVGTQEIPDYAWDLLVPFASGTSQGELLDQLMAALCAIRGSLQAKGAAISQGTALADWPTAIQAIEGGDPTLTTAVNDILAGNLSCP